jgi:hypothetical protein
MKMKIKYSVTLRFFISMILGMMLMVGGIAIAGNMFQGIFIGSIIMFVINLVWGLIAKIKQNTKFSWQDLFAGIIGIIIGVVLVSLLWS